LEWGTQITLSTGAKAYVLKPTLNDVLMTAFKRVTQVIYPKDISLMIFYSGIKQGSKVLESGVGTGFLTAALAWYVGNEGHIYGYEINEKYVEVARRNLELIGLADRVTIKNKDVTQNVDEAELDAAFLDIPNPWDALPQLNKALKPSATAVIFVPTVNQIIKTTQALLKEGFIDVKVFETTLREYQPNPEALRPKTFYVTHTGYIITARKTKQ